MAGLDDLSRCNDLTNAINNSCKRLVEARDKSIFILNQEGGINRESLNRTATECAEYITPDEGAEETLLPWVFRDKFISELMSDVFKRAIPAYNRSETPTKEIEMTALGRSVLPGLATIRATIRQMLAETNNDSLSSVNLTTFFDDHLCGNVLCIKDAFGTDLPRLNVSHPRWFYFPDDKNYLSNVIVYLRSFIKEPVSHRCSLCDMFFSITQEETPIDLFGLPEQFRINNTICAIYGKFQTDQENMGGLNLSIQKYPDGQFVSTIGGTLYY